MYRFLVIALAPFALACSSSSDAAPSTTTKAQPASTSNDQQTCVDVFTRNRNCSAEFIPALVDSRAKLDLPPGIAAKVKQDRDGMITIARQEWATDSTDDAIAATCHHLSATLSVADRGDADTSHTCLAQADCAAYVACVIPVFEKHLAK